MPKSCVEAKKNPRWHCQSLLVLWWGKKRLFFLSFFFLNPLSIITPTFFSSSAFSPSTSVLDWEFLCRRTECGEETEEQSAAVWSSSCCLPDQRGNKRGLPGPTLLWRCLTDSQQLGPHSPPCRGQAAGLQGPELTCPLWTRGRGETVLDGEGKQQQGCLCLSRFVVFLSALKDRDSLGISL